MKSCDDTPWQVKASLKLILDRIPPSFKNRKRICGRRLVTDRKVKQQMETIIEDFVSLLQSNSRTSGGETWMESHPQSWIALCVPADDCWTQIPELHVSARLVPKGQEGVTITIEPL